MFDLSPLSLFWAIFGVMVVGMALLEFLAYFLVAWKTRRDQRKSMGTPVADVDLKPHGIVEIDGRLFSAKMKSGAAKKGDLLRVVGKSRGVVLVEALSTKES